MFEIWGPKSLHSQLNGFFPSDVTALWHNISKYSLIQLVCQHSGECDSYKSLKVYFTRTFIIFATSYFISGWWLKNKILGDIWERNIFHFFRNWIEDVYLLSFIDLVPFSSRQDMRVWNLDSSSIVFCKSYFQFLNTRKSFLVNKT